MATHKSEVQMTESDLEAYYKFFMELPPTYYLQDIEIQDDYDKTSDYSLHGLSDEQVSQIAVDSLEETKDSVPQGSNSNPPLNPNNLE